ncbi:MAG: T9SS type A sorting domain-containing protein [Calditrichota bacterium]
MRIILRAALILFLSVTAVKVYGSVELETFRIWGMENSLSVGWSTSSETANASMELWRAETESGPYVLISIEQGHGTTTNTSSYWHYNSGLLPNQRYFHYLIAVDTAGYREIVSDTVSERTAPIKINGIPGYPKCPTGYRVSWTVHYEYDILDYTLRRGPYGGCNTDIAIIPSQGNTDSIRTYYYTDLDAPLRVSTYCIVARRMDSTTYAPLFFYIPEEQVAIASLDSFAVTPASSNVEIFWRTNYESWLRCYEVQRRRTSDSSYTVVAELQGAGYYAYDRSYTVVDTTLTAGGTYNYLVGYTDAYEVFRVLCDSTVEVVLSGAEYEPLAQSFALSAFPNPFNPTTTISFSLPKSALTHLIIYDLLGREVAVLTDGMLEAGEHRLSFDGTALPSGLYFARLHSGSHLATHKLLLLK